MYEITTEKFRPDRSYYTFIKRRWERSGKTNPSILKCPIEDAIEDYRKKHLDLPEAYMEELVSGFPYIVGNSNNIISCYA